MLLTTSLAVPTSPIHLSPGTAAKLDCKGGDPSLFLPHGWGGALAQVPHTTGVIPAARCRCQGAGAAEPRVQGAFRGGTPAGKGCQPARVPVQGRAAGPERGGGIHVSLTSRRCWSGRGPAALGASSPAATATAHPRPPAPAPPVSGGLWRGGSWRTPRNLVPLPSTLPAPPAPAPQT